MTTRAAGNPDDHESKKNLPELTLADIQSYTKGLLAGSDDFRKTDSQRMRSSIYSSTRGLHGSTDALMGSTDDIMGGSTDLTDLHNDDIRSRAGIGRSEGSNIENTNNNNYNESTVAEWEYPIGSQDSQHGQSKSKVNHGTLYPQDSTKGIAGDEADEDYQNLK
jgi:hypothetical protein